MNDQNDSLLLDHEADGIRELDNKLPRWWVWLFYITIVFSVIYLAYYHVLRAGDLMTTEYDKEMRIGNGIKSVAMKAFERRSRRKRPANERRGAGGAEI